MSGRRFGQKYFWLGFYGCSAEDRIVAVRPSPARCQRPFYGWKWKIECPACGEEHAVNPLWRKATEHEQRKKAEAAIVLKDHLSTDGVVFAPAKT